MAWKRKAYTKCKKTWKKIYRKAQNNLEDISQLLPESLQDIILMVFTVVCVFVILIYKNFSLITFGHVCVLLVTERPLTIRLDFS